MGNGTTFVALDDSKRKIVAGILRPGATESELREIPSEPALVRRLIERLKREGAVAVCYEAGVSGDDLYHQIIRLGVSCQVIAPALTPRRPGQRIKTDKRDARLKSLSVRGVPSLLEAHRRCGRTPPARLDQAGDLGPPLDGGQRPHFLVSDLPS
jgi:hypothetical protein